MYIGIARPLLLWVLEQVLPLQSFQVCLISYKSWSDCAVRSPSVQKSLRLRPPDASEASPAVAPLSAVGADAPALQRSKLTSPQTALTPRSGRRSGKLPVAATGNDALLGARLGIYSEADAMMHRVRTQPLAPAPGRPNPLSGHHSTVKTQAVIYKPDWWAGWLFPR